MRCLLGAPSPRKKKRERRSEKEEPRSEKVIPTLLFQGSGITDVKDKAPASP